MSHYVAVILSVHPTTTVDGLFKNTADDIDTDDKRSQHEVMNSNRGRLGFASFDDAHSGPGIEKARLDYAI